MSRKEVHGGGLYGKVLSLDEGTIFQVENGAPWLRTKLGVVDLIPSILPQSLESNTIPERWKLADHSRFRVFVIYEEGES